MRTFDITATVEPTTVRLLLRGELDYTTADELVEVAEAHLTADGLTTLRLDCSTLAWCDSSGLAAILNLRRVCATKGVELHLDNRNPHLDRVLELTGTLEHLTSVEP